MPFRMPVRLKPTKSLWDERQSINYKLRLQIAFSKHVPGAKTKQGLLRTASEKHHDLARRREQIDQELKRRKRRKL